VLLLMMWVVNNFDKFQINNSIDVINIRINDHLHLSIMHLPYQKGVYSGVKLFNILPPKTSALKRCKTQFRIALQNCLLSNTFYSTEDLIEHAKVQLQRFDKILCAYMLKISSSLLSGCMYRSALIDKC
jgi:hypothetical protein